MKFEKSVWRKENGMAQKALNIFTMHVCATCDDKRISLSVYMQHRVFVRNAIYFIDIFLLFSIRMCIVWSSIHCVAFYLRNRQSSMSASAQYKFHFHLLRVMALDFKIMRVWLVVAFSAVLFSNFNQYYSRSYLFICFYFSVWRSMPVFINFNANFEFEIEREMILYFCEPFSFYHKRMRREFIYLTFRVKMSLNANVEWKWYENR